MHPNPRLLGNVTNDNSIQALRSLSFLPKCSNGNKPRTTKQHADEKAEPESYIPRSKSLMELLARASKD